MKQKSKFQRRIVSPAWKVRFPMRQFLKSGAPLVISEDIQALLNAHNMPSPPPEKRIGTDKGMIDEPDVEGGVDLADFDDNGMR